MTCLCYCDYPEASYERRGEILREHETYQKGLMYFLGSDPRVPRHAQAAIGRGAHQKSLASLVVANPSVA